MSRIITVHPAGMALMGYPRDRIDRKPVARFTRPGARKCLRVLLRAGGAVRDYRPPSPQALVTTAWPGSCAYGRRLPRSVSRIVRDVIVEALETSYSAPRRVPQPVRMRSRHPDPGSVRRKSSTPMQRPRALRLRPHVFLDPRCSTCPSIGTGCDYPTYVARAAGRSCSNRSMTGVTPVMQMGSRPASSYKGALRS